MPEPEFTDAQIEGAIAKALEKRDVGVVPGLIALLALQNPERADHLRNLILFAIDIASKRETP